MPNRMLRDWTASDKINGLSVHAERFFVRLIMKVDDYGCFYGDSRLLKASLFPLLIDTIREADLLRWMAECQKTELIVLYEVSNKKYLQIIDFRQRLDRAKSKFPLPDNESVPIVNDFPPEVEVEVEEEVEPEVEGTHAQKVSKKEKLKKETKKEGRDHPFTESEFFDFEKFEVTFEGTDYANCDLRYYHERMKNWAQSKGVKRKNWIAQARNFMLGDADQNKLRLKTGVTNEPNNENRNGNSYQQKLVKDYRSVAGKG